MSLAEEYIPRYTVEDYRRWEGDWELINGIAYAMAPSPFGIHQRIIGRLLVQILSQINFCEEPCYLYPELDWIDQDTVVMPDLMVVCKDVPEHLKEPPEVVIEVVSPNTAIKDEVVKFSLYEREKVRFYIMVYFDIKKVRLFELKDNKYDKVFDSDMGSFEIRLREDCTFKIEPENLFI